MNPKRFDQLMEAYLHNRLTTGEAEEMSRQLVANPALRRQFWESAAVHGLMQEATRLEWLGAAASELAQKPRWAVEKSWWWRWALPWTTVTAALVVFVSVWLTHKADNRSNGGVAILTRSVDAKWADARVAWGKNSVLPAGTLRLKSGAVEIEFYSGAQVMMEGPAMIDLISSKKAFAGEGRISAHVPPQARGFTVLSSNVTVVDYGTDFGLAVAKASAEEVHVFDGRVEVAMADKTPRLLTAGKGVRVEADTFRNIPADHTGFLTEAAIVQRDSALAHECFKVWREMSRKLSKDPATLLYYTFENPMSGSLGLMNRVTTNEERQGFIVGCTWTEGRWPDKQALDFHAESDRVRFLMSESPQKITCFAWVRVDSLPNRPQSLFCSDLLQTGAVHWELSETGRLRISIGRDLGHNLMDWEVVGSEPIITPARLGQWVMLASTFDRGVVRHYCNGRLVGAGQSFRPNNLIVGVADIGNSQTAQCLNFLGSMDEIAILDRVMNADEVRRVYEAGKP